MEKLEQLESRYYVALIVFVASIFFFSRLYEPSLSGDAAKYALIAKNMLKSGNFLVPNLTIDSYFKKPPFFFWIIALSFKIFGFNEFAARLPSALFAILDSVLIYFLVRKISTSKIVALLSSLVFILNFEVIRISTTVRFESFLLFINLLTIIVLQKVDLLRTLLIGILVGIGLLTKGPFAFLGLFALIIVNFMRKDWRSIAYLILTSLIALSLFGIYILYMLYYYPQFLQEFFGRQIIGRFEGTLNEGTPRPFYFYERIILKHFWIWNVFLIYFLYMAFRLLRNKRFSEISELFLVKDKKLFLSFFFFFLVTYVPLHLISIKFTRYSYYLYPFLSFVVANVILRLSLVRFVLIYVFTVVFIYGFAVMICPCTFHKDKLKDLRPLVEVGLSNYSPLGVKSSAFDRTVVYALLFYFDDLNMKFPEYLVSSGKDCKNSLLRYKDFCIVKVEK